MYLVVKLYKYASPTVSEVFDDEVLAKGYADIMNKKEKNFAYQVFKLCE